MDWFTYDSSVAGDVDPFQCEGICGAQQQAQYVAMENPLLPVISSPAQVGGLPGTGITYVITAENGPNTFYVIGLPDWLAFDGVDTVSGTIPDQVPNTSFLAIARNGYGEDRKTVFVETNCAPPVITSADSISITPGNFVSYTATADNTPVVFSVAYLPLWLAFDGEATISGTTPSNFSQGSFSLTASSPCGQQTINVNLCGGVVPNYSKTVIATSVTHIACASGPPLLANASLTFTINNALPVGGSNYNLRLLCDGTYSVGTLSQNGTGTTTPTDCCGNVNGSNFSFIIDDIVLLGGFPQFHIIMACGDGSPENSTLDFLIPIEGGTAAETTPPTETDCACCSNAPSGATYDYAIQIV